MWVYGVFRVGVWFIQVCVGVTLVTLQQGTSEVGFLTVPLCFASRLSLLRQQVVEAQLWRLTKHVTLVSAFAELAKGVPEPWQRCTCD